MRNAARRVKAIEGHLGLSTRSFSTTQGEWLSPLATAGSKKKKEISPDKKAMLRSFHEIVNTICSEMQDKHEMPDYAKEWLYRMFWFTTPTGKLNRGLSVVHTLRDLKKRELSAEETFRAHALGWCIEFLQAFFLVTDDMMDDSITRRGRPCWYRYKHPLAKTGSDHKVGMIAINDGITLESCIYLILKYYFRKDAYYVDLMELFHEVTYQTELGQLLDTTAQPPGDTVDLRFYTLETYKKIVKYKTAFYSFYLPVVCGLMMHGITDKAAFDEAKAILLPMGEYFQVTDDYLDCYGSPEVIGKIGTDIQDAKCSWLVVQALDRANERQRAIIVKHYGKDTEEDIAVIKKLYKELKLEAVYQKYEEESYTTIKGLIDNAKLVPAAAYNGLFKKIYKRTA